MEIQNVVDYCLKCENVRPLLEKRKQGIELEKEELQQIRYACSYCRAFGRIGIYKADAIISALELYEKHEKKVKRNVGKKPVREKQYGTAIRNLKAEGKTIRQIAEILGISKTTVQKILKSV